jgi:hypothetical protein
LLLLLLLSDEDEDEVDVYPGEGERLWENNSFYSVLV